MPTWISPYLPTLGPILLPCPPCLNIIIGLGGYPRGQEDLLQVLDPFRAMAPWPWSTLLCVESFHPTSTVPVLRFLGSSFALYGWWAPVSPLKVLGCSTLSHHLQVLGPSDPVSLFMGAWLLSCSFQALGLHLMCCKHWVCALSLFCYKL